MSTGIEWTEMITARLRALWSEGRSSAEIGRQMGLTKNAILGRAHRIGLSSRPSPIIRTPEDAARSRATRAPKQTLRALPSLYSPSVATRFHPSLLFNPSLAAQETPRPPPPAAPSYISPSSRCAFPLWRDNEKPTQLFCDAPAKVRSYCRAHASACYMNIRRVLDEAA